MVPSLKEKRRFPRIKFSSSLRYQIIGKGEYNNTLSDNISLSGLGLIDNQFVAPKTILRLEINLLSRILKPVGRIAWSVPLPHSDRYRWGIEFLELEPQDKRYLTDYIDMQMGKL